MNKSLALTALAAIAHASCPLMSSSSSHGHSSPSHGHTSHGHTTSSSSNSYLNTSNDHPWMKSTSSHSHPAPVLSSPSYGHQTSPSYGHQTSPSHGHQTSHSYGHTTTHHAPAPAVTHSHTSYQQPKVQSAFDLTKKALSPEVTHSQYSGAYGVPTAFDLTGGTMKSMVGNSFSKFSKPAGKATSTLTHSHY